MDKKLTKTDLAYRHAHPIAASAQNVIEFERTYRDWFALETCDPNADIRQAIDPLIDGSVAGMLADYGARLAAFTWQDAIVSGLRGVAIDHALKQGALPDEDLTDAQVYAYLQTCPASLDTALATLFDYLGLRYPSYMLKPKPTATTSTPTT